MCDRAPTFRLESAARPLLLLAVLLLTLILSAPIAGAAPNVTTRYVTETGTDLANPDCAQSNPCRTITHAVDVAIAGDTIRVGPGQFPGAVTINKNLKIRGAGPDQTFAEGLIEGVNQGPVIRIEPETEVRIIGIGVRLGLADMGGGIRNLGDLRLNKVNVSGNHATGSGGGIYNEGILRAKLVSIVSNIADVSAGGIFNAWGSIARFKRANIEANRALTIGGASNAGRLDLQASAIINNKGSDSIGALFNEGEMNSLIGFVSLASSTVSGNKAPHYPGIYMASGTVGLHNVTITKNRGLDGSGIYSDAGALVIGNTIVAKNNKSPNCVLSSSTTLSSLGNNLVGDDSCEFDDGTSFVGDPLLGPLAANGGFTRTHALLPESPAMDAGNNDLCSGLDQRYVDRPRDGDGDGTSTCDIGAFEY